MSKIKYFPEDMDVQNKTVILRLDLNVPLNEKKILDNNRILTSLPFLKNLIKKKAKIIIISHLGRPKGVKINELSLTPIYKFLKEQLETNVYFFMGDINEKTNPIEAGLKWITKFEKKQFIGKNNLKKHYKNPLKKLICIEMKERAIPRNGNSIYYNDDLIGEVTSGTMSPSLKKGIGLGYVYSKESQIGTNLLIDIRGNKKKGCIIDPPFYKYGSLTN